MPLYYSIVPGAQQTTNGTGGTENDSVFMKPGTRTLWCHGIMPAGKANGATAISGITYRLKKWTTTASSAGTAVTPSPRDPGFQASKHTAGYSAAAVTSGTGGPTFLIACGSGTSTPGPWFTENLDHAYSLEGSDNKSMDLFVNSPAASQAYEVTMQTAE